MGTTNILDLNNRVDELEKSYPASQVMMSDGVTSVEEVASEIEKIIVRNGTKSVTGVSNNWVYMNITFDKPFKKQPLVTVNQYDTSSGNSWYPPILKNITVNGFTAGWYNTSGTNEFIWQAVGVG